MALITSILPDVDGDLHTADLHNTKFNTILNEINGNLDLDNLKYPKSFMTLSWRAGAAYDIADGGTPANRNPFGYVELSSATGSGIGASPNIFNTSNDRIHALTDSFHKVPTGASYTIRDLNVVAIKRDSDYFDPSGSAGYFTFTLQTSSSVTGTWSNLWTTTETMVGSATNIFGEIGAAVTPITSTVASAQWIRFTITNPSGWTATHKLAPEIMVNLVVRIDHTS